jgi:hypothetical protein
MAAGEMLAPVAPALTIEVTAQVAEASSVFDTSDDAAGDTSRFAVFSPENLDGSSTLREIYEDLQAVREMQQLEQLRAAFDSPLGGDEGWLFGGDKPTEDHGNLLDLPESPTDAGPALPLGWGDDDPRDPQSMFPATSDEPRESESRDGVADAFERIGWVSTKEGTEPPSVILGERRTQQPDGSSTRTVAREYEDGTLELVISRKSANGTHSTTHIRVSRDHTEYHYHSEGSDGSYVGYDEARYYSPDGVWAEWHGQTHVPGMESPLYNYGSGPLPAPRDERPDAPDSDWFSPLHPDPWATFLAWWTHRTGPSIYRPGDDFDTGPDDGSSSSGGSAAPSVGIEAVINPGGADWGPSVPGSSGGDGDILRPDDPFPEPPSSK